MGQHRHLRMAWLSHADQSGFPLPRLDPGCTHRARPSAVPRSGPALLGTKKHRHSGVVEFLLQSSDDGAGTLSRARLVHPTDEAEEHTSPPKGRRADHPLGPRVLRLGQTQFALNLLPVESEYYQNQDGTPGHAAADKLRGCQYLYIIFAYIQRRTCIF